MSSVSQTPAPRAALTRSFAVRFGAVMAAAVAILSVALVTANGGAAAVARGVAAVAARAHPHLPDLALVAQQSPAIKAHLFAALGALALGGVLMTARKGRAFHRVAGWVWVGLVGITAGASLFITSLNHGHWSLIHLLTAWVLLMLPLGVIWARRHNVAQHRKTMMGLFYGGFAINLAFTFIPGRLLWQVFFG